jgi:MoxR-like ATPase
MPSDITGTDIIEEDPTTGRRTWTFVPGPIFGNILLADEINRTPPKTQSALLEAMQEKACTVRGHNYKLPAPFFVLATQNPIELEGTYPLPEAQLDRFLLKIRIDFPTHADEVAMTRSVTMGKAGDKLAVDAVQTLLKPQTVRTLQQMTAMVEVSDEVLDYAVRIVRKTREFAGISSGAGSRGCLALVRAARALALMGSRNYVTPDDVKHVALACLRHRVRPAPELEIEGRDSDSLLNALLEQVAAPRQ